MQTMTPDELVGEPADDMVSSSFEACAAFGAVDHGSPVCGACGWLDTEHTTVSELAEVRELPRPRARRGVPKRLAS